MARIPSEDEVRKVLRSLEPVPLLDELRTGPLKPSTKPWIIRTYGGKPLPVDQILRRSEPNNLVGKK